MCEVCDGCLSLCGPAVNYTDLSRVSPCVTAGSSSYPMTQTSGRPMLDCVSYNLWETLPAPTWWVSLFGYYFLVVRKCCSSNFRSHSILHATSVETKNARLSLFAVFNSSSPTAWFVLPHSVEVDSPSSLPSHVCFTYKSSKLTACYVKPTFLWHHWATSWTAATVRTEVGDRVGSRRTPCAFQKSRHVILNNFKEAAHGF